MVSSRHLQCPECDSRMLHAPQTLARQSKAASVYLAGNNFYVGTNYQTVNAGEMLRRLAGVKVQHGRKQKGPPRLGTFLFVAFYS
jgi:hypothetical protein